MVQIFLYYFIYWMLTKYSLFNSNELLTMRVLPSFQNTYKGTLWNQQWLAIFTTEGKANVPSV